MMIFRDTSPERPVVERRESVMDLTVREYCAATGKITTVRKRTRIKGGRLDQLAPPSYPPCQCPRCQR